MSYKMADEWSVKEFLGNPFSLKLGMERVSQ